MLSNFDLESINKCLCSSHNCTVINVDQNNHQALSTVSEEHCLIHLTSCEAQLIHHDFHQPLVPPPSKLFQVIQSFAKSANFTMGSWDGIAGRLSHEEDFVRGEYPIQISTLDVNLMNFKVFNSHYCEDSTN